MTIVRVGAPSGTVTATEPGTAICSAAFVAFTTVGGEQGVTTTVRARSPAGSTTARDPSVLNGFGFDFVETMPVIANAAIRTPMMMRGIRTLPGGEAVVASPQSDDSSATVLAAAARGLLRHRARRRGDGGPLARQREAAVLALVLIARGGRARRHDQRRDLRVVGQHQLVRLRRP